MTPPPLPLSEEARQAVMYAMYFDTRAGFMQIYAQNLAGIWHTSFRKKGLKTRAYETTERQYEEHCFKGRKYPDFDNFRCAWCRHCSNPSAKDS